MILYVINNKLNLLLNVIFITNFVTYNIYHNFTKLKNEFFVFCNSYEFNLILINLYNIYVVDLFCMDNSYIKYLNIFKKNVFYLKYYVYNFDIFINLFSSTFNKLPAINNISFLSRECQEFFNIKFYNIFDTRNLLCEYSSKSGFLLKSVPLDSYVSIKHDIYSLNIVEKTNIIL